MGIIEAVLLGLLQGATEFLPVSSSGHLALAEHVMGLKVAELEAFDVALHGATLAAILVYYGRRWIGRIAAEPRLGALAVLAGVPAGILYLAAGDEVSAMRTNIWALGGLFVASGCFLAIASFCAKRTSRESDNADARIIPRGRRGVFDVVVIGLAQAIALFPGVSRSGATIGAGVLVGLDRAAAFEFSFLAAAPLLAGALVVKASDIGGMAMVSGSALVAGAAVAFASGLGALALLRTVVVRGKLWVFGLYAVVVGLACIAVAAWRVS